MLDKPNSKCANPNETIMLEFFNLEYKKNKNGYEDLDKIDLFFCSPKPSLLRINEGRRIVFMDPQLVNILVTFYDTSLLLFDFMC